MPILEQEQFIQEVASWIQETHRIPDPYHYLITAGGELFSPTAKCRIKDTIEDKTSHLGQLEYQAVLTTEQWAARNKEGVIVWVSPPHPGVYPATKIVISEIEHEAGRKRLFNRAVVLDFDKNQCMKLAWNLTSFSLNKPVFVSLDQIRATPLILDTKSRPWIDILEQLIDDPLAWQMVRDGEDKRLKKQALRQATMVQKQFFTTPQLPYSSEAKIAIMQMLGPYQSSCPPKTSLQARTGFTVFSENAVTYVGSSLISKDPDFCKSCPVCGEEIYCIVRVGGSCPACGAVKRCG